MHAQATPGQPWAYAGYKLTVYSNTEETLNDLMWWDTVPKVRETLCNCCIPCPLTSATLSLTLQHFHQSCLKTG